MSLRETTACLLRLARLLCASLTVVLLLAESASPEATSVPDLHAVASRLAARLGGEWEIQIAVVERNERMVSVERLREPQQFVVKFDREFLSVLSEGEIAAAIAHEIGHIWIFCHFPFLHTEVLANEIALNIVERKDLESLYIKLQAHLGAGQTVEEFLASNIPARSAHLVQALD